MRKLKDFFIRVSFAARILLLENRMAGQINSGDISPLKVEKLIVEKPKIEYCKKKKSIFVCHIIKIRPFVAFK